MSARVILCGDITERYEAERLLAERHPDLHVETVGRPWEVVERSINDRYDIAMVLKGPIAEHQQRLDAISGLRRNGFAGRILYAGAFLTEKQDAVTAGADYAFDPDQQTTEEVVSAGLFRPALAADHPYLRYLFIGEWAAIEPFQDELPAAPPDVLIAATSCHPAPEFYVTVAAYCRQHPGTNCILVEDDGGDARIEALATGIQPYVVLAEEGLQQVASLGKRFLREHWLARVTAAK